MHFPCMTPRQPRRRRPAADTHAIVNGLRRIVRALELFSRETHRDFGLTAPQLWALKALEANGPLSVGALAEQLHVHQSSVSILLTRLEERGLVRRVRQASDRRVVCIELTDRAVALCRRAPAAAQGRLVHGLSQMPAARLARIRQSIEDLTLAMEAENVEATFFFPDG
jgi:DNA-binding MarR family transcriptional regulator